MTLTRYHGFLMEAQTFAGRIENGRILLDRQEKFLETVASLNGRRIKVSLEDGESNGSIRQMRNYYWSGVVRHISNHTGHTEDEVHEALKQHFLIDRSSPVLPRVRSTSSLTKEEFAIYLERCICMAATMDIVVEDPILYRQRSQSDSSDNPAQSSGDTSQ